MAAAAQQQLNDLYSRLDPYLRLQLQKRGVTVTQNIYIGYDTEYELINQEKFLNKLLSLQLTIQTKTYVKIPLYKPLKISYVHPLTSALTDNFTPRIQEFLETSPENCVEERVETVDELPNSKKNPNLNEM